MNPFWWVTSYPTPRKQTNKQTNTKKSSLCGVSAKMLDSGLEVSESEFQSRCFVHLGTSGGVMVSKVD